ncbi:MAG: hypothetical protein LR015_13965 [Verrucomicrobia bacterium]|nr:hypothetical protein [Verrucomicrobiota bacterium]
MTQALFCSNFLKTFNQNRTITKKFRDIVTLSVTYYTVVQVRIMKYNHVIFVGRFFFAGFVCAVLAMLLGTLSKEATLLAPFFYGFSFAAGGVAWILLARYLNISRSSQFWLTWIACAASAFVACLVLLQFGYVGYGYYPNPGLKHYIYISSLSVVLSPFLVWMYRSSPEQKQPTATAE